LYYHQIKCNPEILLDSLYLYLLNKEITYLRSQSRDSDSRAYTHMPPFCCLLKEEGAGYDGTHCNPSPQEVEEGGF
jgi:hypothetical protein